MLFLSMFLATTTTSALAGKPAPFEPKLIPVGDQVIEPFFSDDGKKVSLRAKLPIYLGTTHHFEDPASGSTAEWTGVLTWDGKKVGAKPTLCKLRMADNGPAARVGVLHCEFKEDPTTFASVGAGKFSIALEAYHILADRTLAVGTVHGQLSTQTFQQAWRRSYGTDGAPKTLGRDWVKSMSKATGSQKTSVVPQRNSGADPADEAYAKFTTLGINSSFSTGSVYVYRQGYGERAEFMSDTWLLGLSQAGRVEAPIMLTLEQAETYRNGNLICRHPSGVVRDFQGYGIRPVVVDDSDIDRPQRYTLTGFLDLGKPEKEAEPSPSADPRRPPGRGGPVSEPDNSQREKYLSNAPGTWTCAFQSGRVTLRSFELEIEASGLVKEDTCGLALGFEPQSHASYFAKIGEKNIDAPYAGKAAQFMMPNLPPECAGKFR